MQVIGFAKYRILEHLATYKFLTNQQLIHLGVDRHRQNVNKHVKAMRDRQRPLVKTASFGFHPKKGKLEGMHYLTKYGKKLLVETSYEGEILLPKGDSKLHATDYFHRRYSIDWQIQLFQQVEKEEEQEVLFFERYFDKVGNNRVDGNLQAKTKIPLEGIDYIIPDGVFIVSERGEKRLYCFEMYNGKDTKRVIRQLDKYVTALALGSPSIKYGNNKSARVLCFFELKSGKEAVMKRIRSEQYLSKRFSKMSHLFFFSSIGEQENVFEWVNLQGEKVILH